MIIKPVVRYESESGTVSGNPSEKDLDSFLSSLDGKVNSYASLTKPNGDYVQVGGGPTEFTVEVREFQKDGSFIQKKATLPKENLKTHMLKIGGADVSVRKDQVLDIGTVRSTFHSFLRGAKADSDILWTDMTEMFK